MPLKNIFKKVAAHPDITFWAEYTAATGAATALVTGGAGLVYGASLPQIFLGAVGVGLIPGVVMGAGMLAIGGVGALMQPKKAAVARAALPTADTLPGVYGPRPGY
jgi:hypothetical protein